jgi:transcription factor TGA
MAFDMEYARWLEEHNKHINELRAAINAHSGDDDLRSIVDIIMAQYDEFFRLKGVAAKADVFHVLSGMWKTHAERCFMWLGGFKSSELLKVPTVHVACKFLKFQILHVITKAPAQWVFSFSQSSQYNAR